MLAADPADAPVCFVDDHFEDDHFEDDHFVPYFGAMPVAKGWNIKRRHAQPGRDDPVVTDARWRAVIFSSGPSATLTSNLPGVLTQLRAVAGPRAPVLLAFDRGGACPTAFTV